MHRLPPPPAHLNTHCPAGLAGHSSRHAPRSAHVWPCADVPAGPPVHTRGGRAAAGKAQVPGAAEVRPQPPSSSKAGRTHRRCKRQAACGGKAGLVRVWCWCGAGAGVVSARVCVCVVTASRFSHPWTGLVVASVLEFHLLHQHRHCDSCRCRRHRHPASQERVIPDTRLSSTLQLPQHPHCQSLLLPPSCCVSAASPDTTLV